MEAKNWNDLPAEIKLECINRMSFKTRWALHYTSHSEKELVESTKCHVEELARDKNSTKLKLSAPSSNFNRKIDNRFVLESILKMTKIGSLVIECTNELFKTVQEVAENAPLHVQDLCLILPSKKDLEIVKNCKGITRLELCLNFEEEIKFADLLESCEAILNVDDVVVMEAHSIEAKDIIQLIEKWIASETGGSFQGHFEADLPSTQITQEIKDKMGEKYKITNRNWGYSRPLSISIREDRNISVAVDSHAVYLYVIGEISSEESEVDDFDSSGSDFDFEGVEDEEYDSDDSFDYIRGMPRRHAVFDLDNFYGDDYDYDF